MMVLNTITFYRTNAEEIAELLIYEVGTLVLA
jgi:hypothetical protein